MNRFEPHGNAQISIRGQVLCFRPEGHGNEEEIERVIAALGEIIPTLSEPGWAALLIEETDALLTPGAEARLTAAVPQLVESGIKAMAISVQGVCSRNLLAAQFRRVFAGAGVPVELFDRESEAESWLKAVLSAKPHSAA